METRIYEVTDTETKSSRLIEAASPAQAVRFVASKYRAEPASAKRVAELMGNGGKVEVPKAAAAAETPAQA